MSITEAPMPMAVDKFSVQLFGGRWDGQWYELDALPERLIVPDQDDNRLYYIRAEWSPLDYRHHGYMRYDHQNGGSYGNPYRR